METEPAPAFFLALRHGDTVKEAGLATHVRTLDNNFRHIDGRPGDNLPIPVLVTKHMVSGGNCVSCSKDECLVILIV